jgi:hypothetical protein
VQAGGPPVCLDWTIYFGPCFTVWYWFIAPPNTGFSVTSDCLFSTQPGCPPGIPPTQQTPPCLVQICFMPGTTTGAVKTSIDVWEHGIIVEGTNILINHDVAVAFLQANVV